MSANVNQPVTGLKVDLSSPLSEVPSVLHSLATDGSSPSSVPNTPSRLPREAEGDHDYATESNDDAPSNNPSITRLSRQEKLEAIIETLRRTRWSFEDMIEAWVGAHGPQDIRVQHRQYHKQEQRRSVLMNAMQSLAGQGICQDISFEARCAAELNMLITRTPFAKFSEDMTLSSIDTTHAVSVIEQVAPTWYALLQRLLLNRRQHRTSYTTQDKHSTVEKRMFAITSMVCFSRAQQASNTLSSCLDVYLVGSGVHRRVVETLHGFGICHSYHHANSLMDRIAAHASVGSPSVTSCKLLQPPRPTKKRRGRLYFPLTVYCKLLRLSFIFYRLDLLLGKSFEVLKIPANS
jgi:hypothetical protein